MSKPACRKGDVTTGHSGFAPRPSNEGSGNVFVNGIEAMREGDGFPAHCLGTVCHTLTMAEGSGSVFINGRAAVRIGDAVECGEKMTLGSPNVFFGD